jgi:hypothetical protein
LQLEIQGAPDFGTSIGKLNGFWLVWFKVTMLLASPVMGFMVLWMSWLSTQVLQNDRRLVAYEERYPSFVTGKEAVALQKEFDEKLSILRLQMSAFSTSEDIPPQWFKESMDQRFKRIEDRLLAIERKLP